MDQLPFEKQKKYVMVKKEVTSSLGADPYQRSVKELIDYGIVNVNKPRGPTSHQVSAYLQKVLNINKSGHSGTLDPNVTGVLPIATERATRIVQALLPAGKEYVGIMHLHKEVEQEKLDTVLQGFVGRIKQLPPVKSSVKRQWRFRNVYYFEILEQDGKEILFKVGTQAGTYIRKLIHDIGQELGTGANMSRLVRTKAGPFKLENAFTLQDVADALWFYEHEGKEHFIRKVMRPIEEAISHLPKIWILDAAVDNVCHGASIAVPGIARLNNRIEKDALVAVMTLKDELVALGDAQLTSKEMMEQEKGIAVKTSKVFMATGTYPRMM